MLLQLSTAELGQLLVAREGSERLALTERLIDLHSELHGTKAQPGDINAWNNSIPIVVEALLDCGLGEVVVQVEVNLPHTNSAVDLVLCGQHPGTGADSYLAVELKQARRAVVDPRCPIAVDLGFNDGKNRNKLHPVRQIQRYCEYMVRYISHLRENEGSLMGAAFLHNARDADVEALFDLPESPYGALYTLDDLHRFRRVLTSRFAPASGLRAATALEDSRRDPLLKVTDLARQRSVVRGGLVLLDEQHLATDLIVRHLKRADPRGAFNVGLFDTSDTVPEAVDAGPEHKRVFILRGGPGSGKSAVALELQRLLGNEGHEAVLASGSRAYTETLRQIMISSARKGQKSDKEKSARRRYQYFNSFTGSAPNSIGVLICDEAHRMRRSSTHRNTPKELRDDDRPQATELLAAARVPVFLLDDHQSIRPDEVGSADYLKELAESLGYQVRVDDLEGTFRAGGSKRYQSWVRRLLGLGTSSDPEVWHPDGRTTLTIADSPEDLEEFIGVCGQQGFTARITAGFCWKWSNPQQGRLVPDVRIGDWHRPWNVKPTHHVPGAPPSYLWSTDPLGIGQIGCVYTAQTFEYDWNGVIIGPDLLFRDGKFIVDRSASRDPAFHSGVEEAVVNRCIRNAYHVLLTRGIAGTIVYAVDPETQNALRKFVTGTIGRQNIKGTRSRPLTAEGAQLPPAYREHQR
ncbi:DNA/RNA helicase domain-containing protein [Kitasatospora sp. NPDC059646]|uniref:DNA/RNA helicase domain-containing protein n=1 Tax=Kitasatospora sp. NPDC059646 TaxID=3346893 RepID=UPI003690D09A